MPGLMAAQMTKSVDRKIQTKGHTVIIYAKWAY